MSEPVITHILRQELEHLATSLDSHWRIVALRRSGVNTEYCRGYDAAVTQLRKMTPQRPSDESQGQLDPLERREAWREIAEHLFSLIVNRRDPL